MGIFILGVHIGLNLQVSLVLIGFTELLEVQPVYFLRMQESKIILNVKKPSYKE